MNAPSLTPLGDAALLATYAATVDGATAVRVHAAVRAIIGAHLDGVLDVAPAYATLAVYFDPARVGYDALHAALVPLLDAAADESAGGRIVEIPVRYDGPDLDDVARATGLGRDAVVARHSAREYVAYMLGFTPGFAYLGELDPGLVLPRRASPRSRVPAGSVAIAASQTAVYPAATPGGWHLIGRTSVTIFDARRDQPALIQPGDRVRFVPVPA